MKRIKIRPVVWIALGILVMLVPVAYFTLRSPAKAEAAWHNSLGVWNYRKKLTVNNAKVSGTADFTNFPVYLDLTDTALITKALSTGYDVLFTSDDGTTKLDYERISYNSSTGQLKAWIEIPTLHNTTDTFIYMYYGNASSGDQQNITGTWNSNYSAVWHMEESSGTRYDATGNNNDLTANGTGGVGYSTSGKVGSASDFELSESDYLSIAHASQTGLGMTDNYTISFWANMETWATYIGWMSKCDAVNETAFEMTEDWDTVSVDTEFLYIFNSGNSTGGRGYANWDISAMSDSTWYFYTVRYDNANDQLTWCKDGVCDAPDSFTKNNVNLGGDFEVGRDGPNCLYNPGLYFDGLMDELHITTSPESNDWVTTKHNNQSAPSTFWSSTGSQEENPDSDAPLAWWKLNEAADNTCRGGINDVCDSTSSRSDGAKTGASWKIEDMCIAGKCLLFDGTDDTVTFSGTVGNVKTVSFWVKVMSTSTTEQLLDLNGTDYLTSVSGIVTAAGFGTETIYVDGLSGATTLTANRWHHVAVTTSTALSASAVKFGQISTNYGNIFLDEVKLFPFALSEAQVKVDYNKGANVLGIKIQEYMSEGLVGYWKMNDNVSGNAQPILDYSGNNFSGSTRIGANLTGMDCTVIGKFGGGCDLDGVDDYINVAHSSTLNLTGPFTLSIWIYQTGAQSADWTRFIQKDFSTGYFVGGGSGSGRDISVWINNTSVIDTDEVLTSDMDNKWQHVVATYDGTNAAVYLNGDIVQTGIYRDTIPGNTEYLGIGGATSFFDGKFDEARIYSRTLTGKEVRDLYSWAPGPYAYWNLDEKGGSDIFDRSGNGFDGDFVAATNIPVWEQGKFGSGMHFDGSDDYIRVSGLNSKSYGAVTYSAWYKSDKTAVTDDEVIINNYDSSDNVTFGITDDASHVDTVRMAIKSAGGTANFYYGTSDVVDGQWHHVAGVRTDTSVLIYVDGTLELNTADLDAGEIITINTALEIGSDAGTANAVDGLLDDIRIYTYGRTPAQIVEDMNGGHPAGGSPISSKLIDFKFNEQQGQAVTNAGNGDSAYNATLGATSGSNTDDPTWKTQTDCKENGCLSFDGSTDYVALPDDSLGSSTTGSVCMWAYYDKASDDGTQGALFSFSGTDGSNTYKDNVYISDTGSDVARVRAVFRKNTASNQVDYTTADNAISRQTWNHFCFVQESDGTGIKLYVNAKPTTFSSSIAGTGLLDDWFDDIEGSASEVTIGNIQDISPDSFFTGMIDGFHFYTSALTSDQVKMEMNAAASVNYGTGTNEAEILLTDGAGNPPVIYYNLDEKVSSTEVYDISGNGNTGAMQGSLAWTKGKTGSALNFDGATNEGILVNSPSSNAHFASGDDLTFMAWVKISQCKNSNPDGSKLIEKSGSGVAIELQCNGTTKVPEFNFWLGGPLYSVAGTTTVDDNAWHHLAGVRDGANLYIYVDGVLEDSRADYPGSDFNTQPYRFGYGGDGSGREIVGLMDEVKVYNYARTSSQVAYDYNRGRPLAHWKFNDCQGATVLDASGNGYNGTVVPGDTSGDNDTVGTCGSGVTTEMWNDGTTGKFNGSLGFDNANDYVSVSPFTSLSSVSDFSVAAWFKSNGTNDTIVQVHDGSATATADELRLRRDSSSTIEVKTNGSTRTNTTTVISTATWYHVAVTRAGTSLKAYFNGKLESTVTDSSGVLDLSLCELLIGTDNDTANCSSITATNAFDGQIDDVQLYNYAISADQVAQIVNQGGGVRFGPSEGSP